MKKLLMSAALIALSAVAANASIIATFQSVTPVGPSDYRYTYTAQLFADQGLTSGSYFVIYDFNGLISGSETTTNGGFTATEMNSGPYPFAQAPADSASIPNVIFTYSGANVNYDPGNTAYVGSTTDLGTFTIDSIYSGLAAGLQSGASVRNSGPQVDAPAGNTTAITVPAPSAVAEPGTTALIGLGFIGIAAAARRRRAK